MDEYYTGSGESAGVWLGGGVAGLGLNGVVDGGDLRAVLAGLAPGTGLTPNGTRLVAHAKRVPGFDLTFAVPKSVSVVYALGDPLVQAAVVAACEAAVAEALGWLEREACFVRRGTNNRKMVDDPAGFGTRRMIADGFVAAQFRHRTSRAGDPHLHWHVLVANLARGIDGRWTALDGAALYAAKRAVGVLFQTVMRRELSLRLGISWGLGLSTCFGPSLAFCFGPSCGWGEWRSVGLGWGAVGGGFPAVVLPGAGAGDAEEIADFGPGAFLVASVGDRGGE